MILLKQIPTTAPGYIDYMYRDESFFYVEDRNYLQYWIRKGVEGTNGTN